MKKHVKFNGKILIIGCGSVSQCAIPLVLELIDVDPKNVTIMDFVDNRSRVKDALAKGVNYVTDKITKENYKALLKKYAGPGDLIIDLAWNIDCISILKWCKDNQVLYCNTSVEEWDPYKDVERNDPTRYTLYSRHMEIKKVMQTWGEHAPTAVVDHGANPGLVSHFTKHALLGIAQKIIDEKPKDPRVNELKQYIKDQNFAKLGQLAGTKVIHISERDTQITNQPKRVNEFVNTWSIEGFFEEGVAPAELGWGTHERNIPRNAHFHKVGPKNQICLKSIGMKTWVRSWVPCGEITGMVIRHGEAFSISDRMSVWENGTAVYRPTVHYAYCPSNAAINSLRELEMRQFDMQKNQRIMSDEIIDGADELGVLLMGHDFNAWWCGSLLDIHTARKLVPHQQATTLQVAVSVVAAAIWMIKNPKTGFHLPDDIDHKFILDIAIPYISPFVSMAKDWTPLKNLNTKFTKYDYPRPKDGDVWQFTTFLVDPLHAQNYDRANASQPDLTFVSLDAVKLSPECAAVMAK
ncbi:MAG: saccharopine dehydrogenase NADP-binding domain-containing protein [Candidatus Margulisbacteria bacterium]|nr:saccharopine dehydrogenase NADP-binding domain-containing protein [Candidatus Margulisiibacteriota bacterium]MBU1021217.1 saccharopine dehydrogenase NADP-binding domain-containing protein [Candidatus Margulisiibacteriota bacterium]MBU1729823.1 saccharopine dehydrogenase NADP-binding domain-containing protein [Candidatus Margulisiibacteriota bacterium]MBU1955324.1 saccharopine dehydrogenase NADP-binding domain-containing protein [Candidatus Margulisiibacteriota bacterium]